MEGATGDPTIAVVVATRDRCWAIPRLLSALDRQEGIAPFEVVVVDDGSTDATASVLASATARVRRPMRVLLADGSGQAIARDRGWRATSAQVVAFTDDDCVPTPDWLASLVRGLGDGADLAHGRILPDVDANARRRAFDRSLRSTDPPWFFQTANVAYRRDALERVGGFDRGFGADAGEDTDLALRVLATGGRAVRVDDALVYHDVHRRGLVEHLRSLPRWAGVARLAARHPEHRDRLMHRRHVWKNSHPPAVLAALGLLLATRHRAAVGLTVPYIRFRLGRGRPPGPRRALPAAIAGSLVADLGEVGVCTIAGVRQRILLW